ncbi:hypothetical protein Pfo_002283 [Paulownia fortunei]|nr:hypothetical protein Pfo_002283 [Paulownia fortunei]
MALHYLRLRRALSLSYSLLHRPLHQPKPIPSTSSHLLSNPIPTSTLSPTSTFTPSSTQLTRPFTSTTALFRKTFDPETDEIGPDTILFEGCDYNHWLITIDFPKIPILPAVEEAKKKIYALSTTTYQGFQVECSEETSEKFKSLPGVVFVLPDSYIDPVNKEYGGDKYVNGEIFPRPPPVHYGRRNNRDRRPRENYGPPPQQNYGPPPQQNYGPPPQQNYGPPPQQNYGPPPQQNYGRPPQQNYGRPPQQNYGPPPQQNYGPPQQNYGPPQPQQSYGPPPPQQSYGNSPNFPPQQNYSPPGSGERRGFMPPSNASGRGERNPMPSYQGNFNQAEPGNHYAQGQRDFQQGNLQSHVSPDQRGFSRDATYGSSQGRN